MFFKAITINKDFYSTFCKLLFLFLLTRLFIFSLGIFPDSHMLSGMWQILSLELLEKNLFKSLYYLHYQPPLWNFFIGLFVKATGPDYNLISICIYFLHMFLSVLNIFVFLKICNFFSLSKIKIYICFFIFIIFSTSYIFYENYGHYTHFTTSIYLLLIINFLNFAKTENFFYEFFIYLCALLLVYTWSAFSHPFFIILIFGTIVLIKYKKNIKRSFLIFLVAIIISSLPSLKNKIEVNFAGNSSWIGFQVIQVLKEWGINGGACNMDIHNNAQIYQKKYIDNNRNFVNDHPSLIGPLSKWNNVGMIYRTKICLKDGMGIVLKNPAKYLNIVKFNFISTHGHYSFDHGFKPKNWNKFFGFLDLIKINKFTNFLKVRSLQLYYLIFYIFFISYLTLSIFYIKKDHLKIEKAISSLFLIWLWMIILTHMFAGFEHERMRHVGHFLHGIFFIILIKNNFNIKKFFSEFSSPKRNVF
mgnify:CR=1 FL=1|tara:strand:+ start:152 stop:1570 length:1419 start_codon:yes stop_codon:yes gene_type:complete